MFFRGGYLIAMAVIILSYVKININPCTMAQVYSMFSRMDKNTKIFSGMVIRRKFIFNIFSPGENADTRTSRLSPRSRVQPGREIFRA